MIGSTMQVEGTRLYRAKAVADMLDVSVSTIYRAIERGELEALKVGGLLRVPGAALLAYLEACGQRAAVDQVAGQGVSA